MDAKNYLNILSKISTGIVLVLLFNILIRLPSLFEPYWYGDEGIYLTLGMALRKGLVIYRDIHDNKPPFLYIIAAIAGTQFWFRFILLAWNSINTYLIYILAKKIFAREKLALVAAFVFTIFALVPEGNIANGEIFMIMPTTAAMLLLYQISQPKAGRPRAEKVKIYFISGILFSLGFLFKAPALFSFAAALCFLLFFSQPRKFIILDSKFLIFILGFIFLPLLSFIYYWFNGALSLYIKAAFVQNFGYLSSWGGEWNKSPISLSSGLVQRGLVLAGLIFILYLLRKYFQARFLLISLWFLFDLFAALLSGRPYPHYLIQAIPSLVILFIFILSGKKVLEKIAVGMAIFLLAFSFIYYKFWHYPVWLYYKNFYQFIMGQKSKSEYYSFFDWRVNETYKLAYLVKTLTKKSDNIFVWGNEPYIYALSGRLPPGRYTVAYHVIDFFGKEETIRAIKGKKPALIILIKNQPKFDELNRIIVQNYLKVTTIGQADVFKKTNFK